MTRDELTKAIGAHIRARRKARKETLAVVSERAPLTLGYLSTVERGGALASVDAIHRVVRALDWSLSELFAAIEAANPEGEK